jgi:hypothetical protein
VVARAARVRSVALNANTRATVHIFLIDEVSSKKPVFKSYNSKECLSNHDLEEQDSAPAKLVTELLKINHNLGPPRDTTLAVFYF